MKIPQMRNALYFYVSDHDKNSLKIRKTPCIPVIVISINSSKEYIIKNDYLKGKLMKREKCQRKHAPFKYY
jgi:hypothetical protein